MKILWKRWVSAEFRANREWLETLRKLYFSTKFPHQEIRWNFGILRSVECSLKVDIFLKTDWFQNYSYRKPPSNQSFFVKKEVSTTGLLTPLKSLHVLKNLTVDNSRKMFACLNIAWSLEMHTNVFGKFREQARNVWWPKRIN